MEREKEGRRGERTERQTHRPAVLMGYELMSGCGRRCGMQGPGDQSPFLPRRIESLEDSDPRSRNQECSAP